MFKPAPRTTVVIPYRTGPEAERGPVVNDAYFGKVPADRLVDRDGVLFFSGDGQHRSKIGLSALRAKEALGSYDPDAASSPSPPTLDPRARPNTSTRCGRSRRSPSGGTWSTATTTGRPRPGKPLGPFYELETSSPAAALAPGKSLTHVHRTFHFRGEWKVLDSLARELLGVGLDAIDVAFSPAAP